MFGIQTLNTTKLILVLSATILLTACEKEAPIEKEVIRPVMALQLVDAGEMKQRTFPGQAEATRSVELSFRVSGPLVELPINVGDEVKKGDVVAKIDPRDFEVSLRNTRGKLSKAQADLSRAQSEFDREMRILEQDAGATSQAAVDSKKSQRDQAKADITSLSASVAAAKDQLKYTQLVAPFDGVIVNKYVSNFESVTAGQQIIRMIDDSKIEMVVNIPESLISLTPNVERVYVRFDSFPELTLTATVKEISSEASETTRTFPVTLVMEQPEAVKILPGMAGKTVGVDLKEGTNLEQKGINVPVAAVFTKAKPEESYVWVIDENTNTVSARKVILGPLTDHGILVTDGLKVSEWIATAGVNYLREGQQVRILKSDKE